jgi:pyrroline-5-carboxylate reductase
MKLSFIGNGAMAKAMIRGALKKYEIEVYGRDKSKLDALNLEFNKALHVKLLSDGVDTTGKCLILCVKPHALKPVSKFLNGTADALISVLAGISLQTLTQTISARHTVRAMPNLAAAHQASMTTLTGDSSFKQEAQEILQSIGQTLWLDSEKELDIATGINGCAPAFLAIVAEALADGAVRDGLKRKDAYELTKGLFNGFAPLLNASDHPAHIKDGVMSPGGVTAAGIEALESHNVRHAFIDALHKAYKKTLK